MSWCTRDNFVRSKAWPRTISPAVIMQEPLEHFTRDLMVSRPIRTNALRFQTSNATKL